LRASFRRARSLGRPIFLERRDFSGLFWAL
jgi:hypothetical protein